MATSEEVVEWLPDNGQEYPNHSTWIFTNAQKTKLPAVPKPPFKLNNLQSGKCLKIDSSTDRDGRNKLTLWGCDKSGNENDKRTSWAYNEVTKTLSSNFDPSKCLDATSSDVDGLRASTCNDTNTALKWTYDSDKQTLRPGNRSTCLKATGTGDGSQVGGDGPCEDTNLYVKWRPSY